MSPLLDKAKAAILNGLSFRGAQNVAAWAVAGGAGYYFWVRPEILKAEERKKLVAVAEQRALPPGMFVPPCQEKK